MKARDAQNLRNGDEVIIKKGRISATVNSVNVIYLNPGKSPVVELKVIIGNLSGGSYATVYHDEVK